jgi:hypothetical protein
MAVATIRREVLKLTPRQMKAASDDDLDDLIMGRTAPQTTPADAATLTQRAPVPQNRPQAQPQQTGAQR